MVLKRTGTINPRLRRGSFAVLLISYFILQTSYVLSGCQYTVDSNPDVNLTEVHVSPVSATVTFGGHLALSASVLGFSSAGTVTWSVDGANNGTIAANGLTAIYSAPLFTSYSNLVTIRVTSDDDPNRYVEFPVVLVHPFDTAFTVNPRFETMLTNATQQFLVDTIDVVPAIRWEIESGPGTISDAGLYTPPASIDSDGVQATIRAVSQTDNTEFSEATITLLNASDSERCFTRDILPILSASCGASGCHDAGGRAGFTALTYSGTVNGRNIIPGNARGSRIYQAIIQFDANSRMPPLPQPALPPNQVLKIGQWIDEGAKDCQ